jgi:hypothetical protein
MHESDECHHLDGTLSCENPYERTILPSKRKTQAIPFMAFDASTILTLTIALAAAAALYLAVEWSSVRESSLLCWSASFAIISVGSSWPCCAAAATCSSACGLPTAC